MFKKIKFIAHVFMIVNTFCSRRYGLTQKIILAVQDQSYKYNVACSPHHHPRLSSSDRGCHVFSISSNLDMRHDTDRTSDQGPRVRSCLLQEWSIFKNSDDVDIALVFNCASLNKGIHHDHGSLTLLGFAN